MKHSKYSDTAAFFGDATTAAGGFTDSLSESAGQFASGLASEAGQFSAGDYVTSTSQSLWGADDDEVL